MRLRTGDARDVLGRVPEGAFDLTVSDVFAAARIPKHLTSVEYYGPAKRALRPTGVHAVNLADGDARLRPDLHRRQVATAKRYFAHVVLVADPGILRGRKFGNLVLMASDAQLPVAVCSAARPPTRSRAGWCAARTWTISGRRQADDGRGCEQSPAPGRRDLAGSSLAKPGLGHSFLPYPPVTRHRALDLHEAGELSVADAAKVKRSRACYADTRVSRIYGGTSEVMKTIIAKSLGLVSPATSRGIK